MVTGQYGYCKILQQVVISQITSVSFLLYTQLCGGRVEEH